jgi:hypothetical protein
LNKSPLKRRILIVGEGRETEYNYFVGFRNMFEEELEATATSVSVARGKGGNANSIVENAIKESKKFEPDRDSGDRVFLLLDTEGPGRAPELPKAEKLAKKNSIDIVYSCPAFEYWLLCHFQKNSRKYFANCDAVIVELNKKWGNVSKARYDKADADIFDRLSRLLDVARAQALATDLHYLSSDLDARRKNPSTQVYELIALMIGARTGEKCPIKGSWKLIGDTNVLISLEKGKVMPHHDNNPAKWRL